MTPRTVVVERTDEATWLKVREMMARTGMTTAMPLAVERVGSEASAFLPLAPAHSAGFIARDTADRGRIVGYVHGRIAPCLVERAGGRSYEPFAYFGDLRVDTSTRRGGIAHALLDAIAEFAVREGVTSGYCLVNEGNDAMLSAVASRRHRFRGAVARTFVTQSRLLVRRPGPAPPLVRIEPTPAAFEALQRTLAARLFAPAFTLEDGPLLARCAPEIEWYGDGAGGNTIAFALWDQRARRRLKVLRFRPSLALIAAGWRATSRFTGAAPPPARDEAWRALEVCLVANPAAVARALPAIEARGFELGCHFVNAIASGLEGEGLGPRAPGAGAAGTTGGKGRGLLVQETRTHVVVFGIDGAAIPDCPAGADLHADLGFL